MEISILIPPCVTRLRWDLIQYSACTLLHNVHIPRKQEGTITAISFMVTLLKCRHSWFYFYEAVLWIVISLMPIQIRIRSAILRPIQIRIQSQVLHMLGSQKFFFYFFIHIRSINFNIFDSTLKFSVDKYSLSTFLHLAELDTDPPIWCRSETSGSKNTAMIFAWSSAQQWKVTEAVTLCFALSANTVWLVGVITVYCNMCVYALLWEGRLYKFGWGFKHILKVPKHENFGSVSSPSKPIRVGDLRIRRKNSLTLAFDVFSALLLRCMIRHCAMCTI